MGNYSFDKDLPVALDTEKEVAKLLQEKYGAVNISANSNRDYDIRATINGTPYTFEIKEDFMSGNTENVAIEFSSRGKPSGIQTTKADFYIYKIHRTERIEFVIHNTTTIKKMIARNLYLRIVSGGDKGSNTLNYLFRYVIFMRHGKLITTAS